MQATNNITIQKATEAHYTEITDVWEASVRATHHFLKEEDIISLKPMVQHQFLKAVDLYFTQNNDGDINGFLGVLEGKIEMLFIHPQARGGGIGKQLLQYAIEQLGCTKVDVNEQNNQAVGFYKHFGFATVGRTDTDSLGMPYPLLQMELKKG
ncbi:MAG: GNAT family N-acetyltransferase [Chitinophagaceae bacterium]